MSATWVPPRSTGYLRVFAISLILVVLCLAGFLFGVHMEARVPASGTITARDLQEVRSQLNGLVELGWYEAELSRPGGKQIRVRLDSNGDGQTDPAAGKPEFVQQREMVANGQRLTLQGVRFHRLEAGDLLWPGQLLATVRADDVRSRLEAIEDQLKELESQGEQRANLLRERDRLRDRLARGVLRVPEQGDGWMAVEVLAAPLQAVKPGDVLASIVPVDPQTGQPRDLMAYLDVDEKHWGGLTAGQTVRLQSQVHNHRLHGIAEARIERLEPWGRPGPNGERQFRALAAITQAPFVLPLGSSFQAEVVVGRKLVYRIILEH